MQFAKKKYDGNFFINIEESKNVHLFFFSIKCLQTFKYFYTKVIKNGVFHIKLPKRG